MNINLDYLKKNQNDVILVKKKKQKSMGCNRFLIGFCRVIRVTPSHDFFYFFQPGPVPAPGRSGPGSTRQAGPGFKTIAFTASKRLISIKMLIL